MSNTLLRVQPSELKIPFELKKVNTCTMQLTNKTDQRVAFKVKTTNPKKYAVRPTSGIIPARGSCTVTVTMQAPKEIPPDYHCKDKFLVQSVVVSEGITSSDIVSEMFSKGPDKTVEEFKLRVIYVPANPPSPVPEEGEEDLSPHSTMVDPEVYTSSILDAALQPSMEPMGDKAADPEISTISRLTREKNLAVVQNQELRQELEVLKGGRTKANRGFPVAIVVIVFVLSIIVGYLINL